MSTQNGERQVGLGEVPYEEANQALGREEPMAIPETAIPKFVKKDYENFRADYSMVGDDIVIHFYLPKRADISVPSSAQAWMEWWLKYFPTRLDWKAKQYFEAEYPRLAARYTEEMASWWFKAQSYGYLLDASAFIEKFLQELDSALQAAQGSS